MSNKTSNVMRVMLLGREAYRVTAKQRGLRVRSGRAWVTLNGHDHVLKRGEEIALQSKHDYAVVSSVGNLPVVIELLGEAPRQSPTKLSLVTNTL